MYTDEIWAQEQYWESKCWVKKLFLWKPVEEQQVHDGLHLLGQIKETDFLCPLSSRIAMQDWDDLVKILILCKVG